MDDPVSLHIEPAEHPASRRLGIGGDGLSWQKMAAADMPPPLVNSLMATPFAQASPPSAAMLVYALVYIAVVVGLAVRWFSRRDL